ncbi:flagellar hook-length control protein FliK [Variovorax paradoxus]|jgi:flagellar hook-length control protein FliK|uniref:flagellar hook-length control protein FliK n=1 Tax=Variovorax paradoxus TaxID=34073 RepID=UPI0029C7902F|nr:flagellar hook-length control protein FliK [Variovorax paradoxus]WPH19577.1 flagellar hook-length control protein FliK [Variovorax paradoxus]
MPSPIAPSFSPNAAASAASSAAAGARGRNAEEPGGRSFDAALARSRNAGAAQAPEEAESSALETTHRRKASRAGDRKDELPAELLPMSFFAPLVAPPTAATAALAAGAPAAASVSDGIQALAPGDAPVDTLAGEATDVAAGKTAIAADAEGETTAQAKPADGGAPAVASDAAQPADARVALQAAAAVPPPTSAGTGTAPAADAATPEATDTAAASAAAVTEPRGTSTASLSADADTDAAPATAMISADKTADLAAASDAAPASTSVPASMPFTPAAAAAARTNVPPASPHTPILSVEPSVGSAAWGKAIGHQVLRMTAAGYQVAELNLNPAGLGPLKVTLTLGDNQAQAMFASAHESVRKALEVALPQLRTSLADHGISLGQASVGAESHPSAGQGGAFGQQPQQQGSPRQADYPGASRVQAIATTEPLRSMPAPAALRRPSAGVDTFA